VDAIRGVALHHRCRADRGGSPGTDDRRRIVRLAWVANQVSFVGSATADAAPRESQPRGLARSGWLANRDRVLQNCNIDALVKAPLFL
jgi:hypothetical protein